MIPTMDPTNSQSKLIIGILTKEVTPLKDTAFERDLL